MNNFDIFDIGDQKKLYYIINTGCDDETIGLAEFNEKELKTFLTTIKNLNRNSTYGCMPTIHVYEISWDHIVENNDGVGDPWNRMYLNDKVYMWEDGKWFSYWYPISSMKDLEEI